MLAFTRKPSDDELSAPLELLLDDADDDLAPLTTSTAAKRAADPVDPIDAPSSTLLVAAPRWTAREREAYASLARFVQTDEPQVGWRRVLFVVSGICLMPSRSERALRSHVATLVHSVDPLLLNNDKEAAQ